MNRSAFLVAASLVTLTVAGCSAPVSDDGVDTSSEDLSHRCVAMTMESAAKLMPAGSSSATVGTFEIDSSSRAINATTGAGSWSAWDSYGEAGDVTFFTTDNNTEPVIGMTMASSRINADDGFSTSTWDIDNGGFVDDGNGFPKANQTGELYWYEKSTGSGASFMFDVADVRVSTCSLTATSLPTKGSGGSRETRIRIKVTFKSAR